MSSKINLANYTFNTHKHNYAMWTAARAVQRGFATTETISMAIEQSDLRKFAEDDAPCDDEQFKVFHIKCSKQLIKAFSELKIYSVTYGRAAKIISIYLKTCVILPKNAICDRSKIIHPPIDSILLTRMSELAELKDLKRVRWTELGESEYWDLSDRLRQFFKLFDWRLEAYWLINQSDII